MRAVILGLALMLLAVMPSEAAPTCRSRAGETMRCGAPGAMPVRWVPSAREQWEWENLRPTVSNSSEIAGVIIGLALFLTMIALLPDFDGSRDGDWDKQEGDDEDSRTH